MGKTGQLIQAALAKEKIYGNIIDMN